VLVRTNDQGRDVQAELRRHGVPTVLRTEASVFDTEEAGHLYTVLAAILDPGSASAVSRALLTPILGRTVADLAEMASDDERWTDEIACMRRWAALWAGHGFARAFHAMLGDAGALGRYLQKADGQRRVGDLLQLGELLHGETVRGRGPRALLQWLSDGGPGADAEDANARLEADDDAVTIVTIHKAKGLEWPLVWVPYLWQSAFVFQVEKRNLRVRLPDGSREIDLRDEQDPEKARRLADARQEAFAELMRVAYVALTRARHRCTVYWGRIQYAEKSPLVWLFHQAPHAPPAKLLGATRDRYADADEDVLLADLRRAVEATNGAIGISPVAGDEAAVVDWRGGEADTPLAARPLTRTRPWDLLWRRASFSAMTRDAWTPDAGRPEARDTDPAGTGDVVAVTGEAQVPLHDVPSFGTRMGDLVHAVLESVDFQHAGDLREVVASRCVDNGVEPALAPRVAAALAGVLRTPLDPADPSFTLSSIAMRDRKSEFEFHLPVAGGFVPSGAPVVASAIADAIAAHPSPEVPEHYAGDVRRLAFAPLHGFLTGSVDLVARRNGRVYVADYKSNRVGDTFASFATGPLTDAMVEHHYVLQGLLYTVAVARWCRVRDRSWRYDTHFGGVLYLFVRGMTPATAAARGVWSWRPPPGLVDALDAVLRGVR
jgi:exodeoxyribonuclease V beta subunit